MKSLIKILAKKKLKISVVESCTGGLLASKITSTSGASKVVNLGFVTYSNQAKIKQTECLITIYMKQINGLFFLTSFKAYLWTK